MSGKSADAFRTISEVADWLGVQTHVLRFWESKFSQVKPVKRAGGRRYYRPSDMLLLGGIRKLLHEDGMTIKGVQKILREEGMAHVADMSRPLDDVTAAQVDTDALAGPGDVETEMAPVAAPDEVPQAAAALEPADTFEEPDLFDAGPEHAEPEVEEPETAATATEAPDPFDLPDAPAEDVTPAETTEPAVPGADSDAAPALPGFMRSPRRVIPDPVAPTADAAAPAEDAPAFEPASPADIPAPEPQPGNDPAPETALPSFMVAPERAAEDTEVQTPPAPPKPAIVDVPLDADPASFVVAPTALSACARATQLTAAQKDALTPLVAALSTLRDRMGDARSDIR